MQGFTQQGTPPGANHCQRVTPDPEPADPVRKRIAVSEHAEMKLATECQRRILEEFSLSPVSRRRLLFLTLVLGGMRVWHGPPFDVHTWISVSISDGEKTMPDRAGLMDAASPALHLHSTSTSSAP